MREIERVRERERDIERKRGGEREEREREGERGGEKGRERERESPSRTHRSGRTTVLVPFVSSQYNNPFGIRPSDMRATYRFLAIVMRM